MPEMLYSKKYLIHKGIGGRERRVCSCSKMLRKLNCIPATHITLHFFFYPSNAGCFIKHSGFRTYEGKMLHHCFCKQEMSGGFFEHQAMWISAVENKIGGRFSWNKYQFSNMKCKKTNQPNIISFQMMGMLFYFSFLTLYRKVCMNFSVADVQPTFEC